MLQVQTIQENMTDDARALMQDTTLWDNDSFGEKILSMVKTVLGGSQSQIRQSVKSCTTILAVVVLTALGGALLEGHAKTALRLAAVCTLCLCVTDDVGALIRLGSETAEDLNVFSKALLPVMAAAAAGSGSTASSAALYASSTAFFSLLVSVLQRLLMPMVKCFLALSAADAALDGKTFAGLKQFAAGTIKHSLRVITLVFSAYLSLTGIISGSVDAITLKAAKMTVSTVVPVVGSMISDATETVLVSAKYLLHSVGVYGMLGTLAVLLIPFVRLWVRYLIMNFTFFLASIFDCERLSGFLKDVSTAIGFIIGIVSCCALLLYVSCICFMRVSVS